MSDLEHALRGLGRDLAFPETPELSVAVGELLRPADGSRSRARPLVLAFAVLALAIGTALAVPPARSAVLELLGIRGAAVERVPAAPSAAERAADLGERVTLAEAERRAAFRLRVPAVPPGVLDAVHVREPPPGGMVSLVYRGANGRVHAILSQFQGTALPFVEKEAGPGTIVARVDVAGVPGLWLEGDPHAVAYRDAGGARREATRRLAGNVLLWERDGITLRLEGELGRAGALRVARSAG